MRSAIVKRTTKETTIEIDLNLDKDYETNLNTELPFLNHMLDAFAFNANISLNITAQGDLDVDDHHLMEDIGICLGNAFRDAINKGKGYQRYGVNYIPMDEALSRVVVDVSNRPYLVYDVTNTNEKIGTITLCNFLEFFRAFVNESRITLHITNLYGENDHHIIESIFKALGKAIKTAIKETNTTESTKGVL
jgi:imidazoleglycerol-phosphate dehydratase